VAERCRAAGGRALVIRTDVRELASVEALGQQTADHFGHIDGWVNNAAVASYSIFSESTLDEFRRILETNLIGVANGTAVALKHLRAARGGVIVNLASVLAEISLPYLAAYNATKHAVRGLSDTLRQELTASGEHEISVCSVLPAAVDTPFYGHAANHTGRAVRPPPPVYSPDLVAHRVVRLLQRPRREVYVGGAARLLGLQWRMLPGVSERIVARCVARLQFTGALTPPTRGNLFAPVDDASASDGGWHSGRWSVLRLALGGAAVGGTGLLARRLVRRHTPPGPGPPWISSIMTWRS
jgi:short-subunit dehydrogenase